MRIPSGLSLNHHAAVLTLGSEPWCSHLLSLTEGEHDNYRQPGPLYFALRKSSCRCCPSANATAVLIRWSEAVLEGRNRHAGAQALLASLVCIYA